MGPPFWGQKIFLLVPLFWKLIKLELLYFKLLCSSKTVDFTHIFLKFLLCSQYKLDSLRCRPLPFSNAGYGPVCHLERGSINIYNIVQASHFSFTSNLLSI